MSASRPDRYIPCCHCALVNRWVHISSFYMWLSVRGGCFDNTSRQQTTITSFGKHTNHLGTSQTTDNEIVSFSISPHEELDTEKD